MGTPRSPLTLAILGGTVLFGLCLSPCLISIACQPDPKAIVAKIPVGSRLTELDTHLDKFYGSSSVKEWIPNPNVPNWADHRGAFGTRDLGEYNDWKATKAERDHFTGELNFYHLSGVAPDDLAPNFVIYLVYVDGVLKEVDYGFLPG